MRISPFIHGLPKVELHMHIEGSLEPAMMLALARRNGIDLPYASEAEVAAAYDFGELQDFLDLYYQGMSVLRTEADFRDLTSAYLDRVASENVRHVEIFFDPQGHTSRGVPFSTVLDGIHGALVDGERRHGISFRLIMCFLRHLSEADGFATLEEALPHRDRIFGVGLDSSEKGFPPSKFTRLFERCREAGFAIMAHAGEEGPPAYVAEALDLLNVDRIDHGNRALEDAALTGRLAESGIGLTVCPLSNLRLRGVPDMSRHPLKRMLEAGLKATVNSDDPAYFGGYMNANYQAVTDALHLGCDDIATLARNAVEVSFAPAGRKRALAEELEGYLASAA